MDWSRGYSARWRVHRVDPGTWADSKELSGVVSAKIERQASAGLLESGSLAVDGDAFEEGYYRISMEAVQDGASKRVDVATLLCSSASGTLDRGLRRLDVEGSSVLQPAADVLAASGSYVPAGEDAVAWAADSLSSCLAAPVSSEGSFTLASNRVVSVGASVLDAVWDVLSVGGYVIRIDGAGSVKIAPMPTAPALVLDHDGAALLHPGVSSTSDWSGVPNRYTAVEGGRSAVAVNDDPASPTSTVSRGRFVDVVDSSPDRIGGESLEAYAQRRLAESSTVPWTVRFCADRL